MSKCSWMGLAALLLLGTQAGCSCGTPTTALTVIQDAGEDVYVPPPVTCDNTQLTVGCVSGRCTVTSPTSPLPPNTTLQLAEKPLPPDLQGDTVAPYLCSVGLPPGTQGPSNLILTMALDAPADPVDILFDYGEGVAPSAAIGVSGPQGHTVVGLIPASGDYGSTKKPADWSVEGYAGLDLQSSGDQASLLRNLSTNGFTDAFYDGTRLYVSNGTRVLIYNGLPANPGVKPDVVLGQPDLDTTLLSGDTSSLFGNTARGIWSDGTRLVVSNTNRILIWNAIPTQNFTPADVVLGQPDFSSGKANNGGVSASALSLVSSLTSDGTQLVAADTLNNRVLLWKSFPVLVDQPADLVIGQATFSSFAPETGAAPFYEPVGVALAPSGLFVSALYDPGVDHFGNVTANNPAADFTPIQIFYNLQPNTTLAPGSMSLTPSGGLAVRDFQLQRIAVMRSVPTGAASIDFALGQPDATRIVESPVSASSLRAQIGLNSGGGLLLVPDSSRLLVYDQAPTYNFEPASRVLGQAGFSTNERGVDYRGTSASTLASPADIAVNGGVMAVADRGNNRVLLFKTSDVTAGKTAAYAVLGQPDDKSYVPNVDQKTPGASTLSGPGGVALDGTHLVVADTENHRVLIWSTVPSATATPADLVLGQADFTGTRPNRGRGDANQDGFSDAAADGFFAPTGVASDGTHLFVSDRLNHRVLVWSSFPTSSGTPATSVIGQPDFVTVAANQGNGPSTVVANGFDLPTGIALVGTSLWVADTENNRVVRWDGVTTSPAPAVFVGQPDGTTLANPNFGLAGTQAQGMPAAPATQQGSVLRPRSVVVAGSRLYVSETDSNRVHMFDATAFTPQGELGEPDDTTSSSNADGVSATSLANPSGLASDGSDLWVADSGNHRVLGYGLSTTPATGTAATLVVGQANLLVGGFNQSSVARGSVTSQPRGLTFFNGQLYVCDTSHHRVLVLKAPPASGDIPLLVYGQPDDALAIANSGGAPSESTMSGPRGLFVDATHVVVADTGNNRVLVFDPTSQSTKATLVLGQTAFTASSPNGAGAPGLGTLQAPAGVYFDGSRLYVADTGNHRVLVWNNFPTQNGQPADLVLGQTDGTGIRSNAGASAPSAASLSFPAAFAEFDGALYIADSGNNRVLRYSTPPTASGAAADGVLGQPDLVSRTAAAFADDLSRLAGPVGLAFDGTDLYVSDRDLSRVVIYRMGIPAGSGTAFLALGESGQALTLSGPGGVAVERTPYFTTRVYVADTGDDQIALVGSVSRLIPAGQ